MVGPVLGQTQCLSGMVPIPGGTFQMGPRRVTVSPFCLSKFVVTVKEFREYVRTESQERPFGLLFTTLKRDPFVIHRGQEENSRNAKSLNNNERKMLETLVHDVETSYEKSLKDGSGALSVLEDWLQERGWELIPFVKKEREEGRGDLWKRFEVRRVVPKSYRLQKEFAGPRRPAIDLDWFMALGYANWRGGRLSTEAEWEWAARAGDRGFEFGTLTGGIDRSLAHYHADPITRVNGRCWELSRESVWSL